MSDMINSSDISNVGPNQGDTADVVLMVTTTRIPAKKYETTDYSATFLQLGHVCFS